MSRLFLLLASVPIAAPAPAQRVDEPQAVKVSSVPAPGEERTVSVGNPIHEYTRYISLDIAIPSGRMRVAPLLIPLTIEAGTPLFSISTKARFKGCMKSTTWPADLSSLSGPCALDDDGDGTFDRIAKDDVSAGLKLKTPASYKRATVPVDAPDNLRQTLLYAGATSDGLRLSYREFRNDLARPAFTEELTIPITKTFPQDVAVKDMRLRLLAIDGLGLRYMIVK